MKEKSTSPPQFASIGKNCVDLFNSGYNFNVLSVKGPIVKLNPGQISLGGLFNQNGPNTYVQVQTKKGLPSGMHVDAKLESKCGGLSKANISHKTKINDVDTVFNGSFDPQACSFTGNIKATNTFEKSQWSFSSDLKYQRGCCSTPNVTFTSSTVVGYSDLYMGCELAVDVDHICLKQRIKYGFSIDNFDACVNYAFGKSISFLGFYKDKCVSVGLGITRFQEGCIKCGLAVARRTCCKRLPDVGAKIYSSGELGVFSSCILDNHTRLTFSTLINLPSLWTCGNVKSKFGLSFEFT